MGRIDIVGKVMGVLGNIHDDDIAEALAVHKDVVKTERGRLIAEQVEVATTADDCFKIGRWYEAREATRQQAFQKGNKILEELLLSEVTAQGCLKISAKSADESLVKRALQKALRCGDVDLEVCHQVYHAHMVSEELKEQAVAVGETIYLERLKSCGDTYSCLRLLDYDNRLIRPTDQVMKQVLARAIAFVIKPSEYGRIVEKMEYALERDSRKRLQADIDEAFSRALHSFRKELGEISGFEQCVKLLNEVPHRFHPYVLEKMELLAKSVPDFVCCLGHTHEREKKIAYIRAIARLLEEQEIAVSSV